MENATKALLIAAAVLVAILVISLGIVIYTRASETVSSAGDLSEYQIQQVNEKFKKYEGSNKSGTDVNAMINTVFNHNLAQEDTTTMVIVGTASDEDCYVSTSQTTSPAKVSTGKRYDVTATYDSSSKLITKLQVTESGSSSTPSTPSTPSTEEE